MAELSTGTSTAARARAAARTVKACKIYGKDPTEVRVTVGLCSPGGEHGTGWFFAGYLAATILVLILMSIAGPGDTVSAAAGCLAILVMGVAEVYASAAFRPTPQVASSSHASELALTAARARMHRRQQARKLAQDDHVLARELGIGRPDVPHDYDDGGLVDVNHVPGDVLASCLGLAPAESAAVIAARNQLGRFTSPEELSAYAALSPDRVEAVRDWMLFG